MQNSISPSVLWQVGVYERRHRHLANRTHVSFGSVVHPLRVWSREALLNPTRRAESSHCCRLVNRAIVGENPGNAVWLANFSLDAHHEFGPDVHPLSLTLGEKPKNSAAEVVDNGQEIQVALR